MTVALFLLALGAAARITRFITLDDLAEPFRAWVARQFGLGSKLDTLVTCPFCVSIYASAAVFSLAWFYGATGPFRWVCAALSASVLIGWVQSNVDGD